MTQNISIRFIGTADFGQAQKQVNAMTTSVSALSAGIQSAATAGGRMAPNINWMNGFKKEMATSRSILQSSVMSLNDFGLKSVKVADHVDGLTERIRAQKFGVGDLIKQHSSLNDVYRQQMATQKAMTLEWSRNGDGSANADVLTRNRNATEFGRNIKNWRSELGMYNKVLGSVATSTVNWGKNTQWAGRQMTAGLSMPLIALAAGTAAMAYQIDKGLTNIVKVYGDATTAATTSDAQIKQASLDTAKTLASTYGQSAKDSLEITAQLAATGKTGKELQTSTTQVSRARLLGELDLQDAMKSTITLQSVYNMNSKELGDAFNYMNSMENQTSLTMQDFVVGIPKVSGVMKSLGGDIRETGILLAAMKIAGIDAAEGANAIKSISFKVMAPPGKGKTMLKQATGQTYEEIVGNTTSVTERLVKLGTAMKDLSAPTRVGIISKLFGLYQGSKALSIIDQLTTGSEQMSRAMEVSQQSTTQWADTSARELQKLTGSQWNKFQQGWESLKISLAEIGDTFLAMGIPVLNFINGAVKGFNNLGEGTKSFIAKIAILAAAFGPVVMFAGLLGNMVGSMGKLSSFIINLIAPFRFLTTEEKAAADISRLKAKTTNDEARAYAILAEQLAVATTALGGFVNTQLESQGLARMPVIAGAAGVGGASPIITPVSNAEKAVGRHRVSGVVTPVPGEKEVSAAKEVGKHAAVTEKRWNGISKAATTFGIIAVAGMASAATESDSIANHIANAAFTAALIGPLLMQLPWGRVGVLAKAAFSPITSMFASGGRAAGLTTAVSSMGTKVTSTVGRMGAAFTGMLPAIGSVAGTIGSIALAAGIAWYVVNKNMEKSRKEMETFNNSAKAYASVIGFSYTEASSKIDATGKNIESLGTKTAKFVADNKDLVHTMQQFATSEDAILQQAASEGAKASMHGATAEQAKQAAMVAARAMGSKLSEAQISMKIDAIIDFSNSDSVVAQRMKDIEQKIATATKNGFEKGWADKIFSSDTQLNSTSGQAIEDNVKALMEIYNGATEKQQPAILTKIRNLALSNDQTLFQELKKNHAAEFQKMGITDLASAKEAASNARSGAVSGQPIYDTNGNITGTEDIKTLQLTEDEFARLSTTMDANKKIVDSLKAHTVGLTEAELAGITTVDQWTAAVQKHGPSLEQLGGASQKWSEWQDRMAKSGAKWSEQEKLNRLNILRLAIGLPKATTSAQGFGDALEEVGRKVDYLNTKKIVIPSVIQQADSTANGAGFSGDMTYSDSEQILSDLQASYSGAMDTIYSGAAEASDRMMKSQMDGITSRYDTLRGNLDKQQEAASKSFDAQVKKFDYAWEDKMDNWTKKWEKRKAATEASYDSQIDKIKAQIKAEEDAEAIRQRIFEAEQTRLSRLAELQNKSIDFNAALRTGKVDEAAKISNDLAATTGGWALTDAAAAGSVQSDARKATLENKITTLEKQKTAALKSLDDIEAAERKQLDRQKDRERELLDARKKAMEDTFAARKKTLDNQEAAEKASAEASIARNKAVLDAELANLKAFVPRDQAELDAHILKIQGAYSKFGTDLTKSGKGWANVIGSALTNSMETTRIKEANTTSWQALGRVIAENMSSGAFNMTLSQFIKWISTGEMPATAGVGYKGKNAHAVSNGKGGVRWQYGNTQGGIPSGHTGGIIGKLKGNRTGFSGNTLSNSEVLTNTLTGEAILNRRATRNLGEDFIDNMNNFGTIPRKAKFGIGGPTAADANISSALAIAPMVVAFRNAIGFMGAQRQLKQDAQVTSTGDVPAGSNAYPTGGGALTPGGWRRPVGGPVTSHFGMRFHPIQHVWKLHTGTDFGVPSGTPVHASRGGKVTYAGMMASYGNHVVVAHGGGLATTYSHMMGTAVKAGQNVTSGQVLGPSDNTGNSTGPHLHFEYMKDGKFQNPSNIIPGLRDGGFVIKQGLAKLHDKETVLTKPLSAKLDEGINKIAEGPTTVTNHITFTGNINGIDDLERAMIKVSEKINRRTGINRKVGSRN